MRIVLLTYSLTRCTRRVADEIARQCRLSGHTADVLDVVPLVRAHLSGVPIGSSDSSILRSADALALGALTWAWKEPPGLADWVRAFCTRDLVASKPAFVFATAGQSFGRCPRDLAAALIDCGCRVVDPARFVWGRRAMDPVAPFVRRLLPRLAGTEPPMPLRDVLYRHPLTWPLSLIPFSSAAMLAGVPEASGAACKGCGLCAKLCPSGAIEMGPDRKPRVDSAKCLGCTRCVAMCPAGAMQSAASRGKSMYVCTDERLAAETAERNNWSAASIQSTFWRTLITRRLWAAMRMVASPWVWGSLLRNMWNN
eukprot:m51a1_g10646 putative 4fe-4s ferredoxin (311) ;mRNA; r:31444-32604